MLNKKTLLLLICLALGTSGFSYAGPKEDELVGTIERLYDRPNNPDPNPDPEIILKLIREGARIDVLAQEHDGRVTYTLYPKPVDWYGHPMPENCTWVPTQERIPQRTALYVATTDAPASVLKQMLETVLETSKDQYDFTVNTKMPRDDEKTALHAAIEWGDVEKTTLLLQYGADSMAKTRKGETPLDYVRERMEQDGWGYYYDEYTEVARLLKQAMLK